MASNNCFKYMDVDVMSVLEEKMGPVTQHYKTDIEIDREMLTRYAKDSRPENKTFLWLARESGTNCVKEHDAFVRDSSAYAVWTFYGSQIGDPIVACAIELTGIKNGVVMGNVYDLDFRAHAAMVAEKAVLQQQVEKTFEDGFVAQVPLERSSFWYYAGLVEEHGAIEDSVSIPSDPERLSSLLSWQKVGRHALPRLDIEQSKSSSSLDSMIQSAGKRVASKKKENNNTVDLSR